MSKLNEIAEINKECFLSDDYYSDEKNLKKSGYEFIVEKEGNKIIGFIIFHELDGHIESLRRAVTKKYRGKGVGLKLAKRLIRIANKRKKDIYTYVSKTNLPSLNSNIKCGYRIYDIGDNWVYLRYKHNG